MMPEQALSMLLNREPSKDEPVLSVYLDVDQSRAANLNRGFETVLHDRLRSLESGLPDGTSKEQFPRCVRAFWEFMASYRPSGKALVAFASAADGVFVRHALDVAVESGVHWGTRPFVRPLLEALGEFDRYLVALVDRGKARFLSVSAGSIEEHSPVIASEDIHHFDGAGKDRMRSQMIFQHRADEHMHHHLKHVAATLESLVAEAGLTRVVLGGAHEAVVELQKTLSERTRNRVMGTVSLAIDATAPEVARESAKVLETWEQDKQSGLVDTLITAAAKKARAVTGMPGVVDAAMDGRIHHLVYASGLHPDRVQWELAAYAFGKKMPSGQDKPVFVPGSPDELLDWLAVKAACSGGSVEDVRGDAANRLKTEADGIGAFLRF